jgi:predicted dehydrogenase
LNSKIPIVVIGVGEHGRNHARELRQVEGAELTGVFDINPDRTREAALEFGVKAFGSLEEALAAARAVSVVIPTNQHAELAHGAFDRGVDVLLEKPITRTLEEADGLIRRAEAEKRILQIGHVERFNPGVVAAKAITKDPVFFEVHRLGVFSPRSLDVDVVFDLMIHDLDLLLWMVDSPVKEVRAVGLAVLSDKVDIANVRVEFENGTVANLTASRVSTEKVRKFRYFQPHEYVSIDFARRDALAIVVDRDGPSPKIGFRNIEAVTQDPLRAELQAFVESVGSRRPPLVGGREGRAALALAVRVMECIEEHAASVNLPLVRSEGRSGEM